jgi:hypothetical protein
MRPTNGFKIRHDVKQLISSVSACVQSKNFVICEVVVVDQYADLKQVYSFPTTYVTVIRLFASPRALTRSTRTPFLKWSDSPSGLYVQHFSCRFGIFPPIFHFVLKLHCYMYISNILSSRYGDKTKKCV